MQQILQVKHFGKLLNTYMSKNYKIGLSEKSGRSIFFGSFSIIFFYKATNRRKRLTMYKKWCIITVIHKMEAFMARKTKKISIAAFNNAQPMYNGCTVTFVIEWEDGRVTKHVHEAGTGRIRLESKKSFRVKEVIVPNINFETIREENWLYGEYGQ